MVEPSRMCVGWGECLGFGVGSKVPGGDGLGMRLVAQAGRIKN